jgi:hypothetical protein
MQPKTMAIAFTASLVGALVVVIAVTTWKSRGSYLQCYTEEMRGQPVSMAPAVKALCRTRYPLETNQP